MDSIKYLSKSVVITIDTEDPSAFHEQLFKSIISNLNYSAASKDKGIKYHEEIWPMLKLLGAIGPTSEESKKAFA